MNKWTLWIVLLVSFVFLASPASSQEKTLNLTTTPSTPKISRLNKVAEKWEGELRGLTTALGEKLNIRWSKKTGVQLFKWDSAVVGLKGGKSNPRITYISPKRTNHEYYISHKNSNDKWQMGYSKKF